MLFNTVPTIAPSGRGIYFPFDSSVSSLSFPGEHQRLTINANPLNTTLTSITLTFNGQTTSPIPVNVSPPPVYFQWNSTLASAGTYDLAVNLFIGANLSPNLTYEIYDNHVKIGRVVVNGQNRTITPDPGISYFNDPNLVEYQNGAGSPQIPIVWFPLGRFTFSSTTLSVRVSAPGDDSLGHNVVSVNDLRVATTDGATVVFVQDTMPPSTSATITGSNFSQYNESHQVLGHSPHIDFYGFGAGDQYTIDYTAVKSALEALPNIGAGNITCSGNGSVLIPLEIYFVNTFGQSAQNLITSNDNVKVPVVRVSAGGIWPHIKINGGSPIALTNPYWYTVKPAVSCIYFALIADMAPVRYQSVHNNNNALSAGWSDFSEQQQYGTVGAITGYAPILYISTNQSATATYTENPLTVGTYRISGTWPHASNLSNDVVYTLKNAAGTTLWTYHVDQTKAPSGSDGFEVFGTATISQLLGDGLVVVQSNNTSSPMIGDTIRFERTSSSIELKIQPTDVVTYTTGTGWITTVNGPVNGVTDAPLLNKVGPTNSLIPTIPTGPQTMKIGWNISGNDSSSGAMILTNLVQATLGFYGTKFDSNGYPTEQGSKSQFNTLIFGQRTFLADDKEWTTVPYGDYVVIWDGTDDCKLSYVSSRDRYTEHTDRAVITGTTNNKRYYTLDGFGYGGSMGIVITSNGTQNGDGTWPINVKNIRIYSTEFDVPSPPKYYPSFINRISGSQCLRFLDSISAISGNATDFSDYNMPQSHLGKHHVRTIVATIASISQYTGNQYGFDPNYGLPYLFTTTSPHGFTTGQKVAINNYSGPPAQLSGPNSTTGTFNFDQDAGCIVVSPTTFIMYLGPHNLPNFTNSPINNPVDAQNNPIKAIVDIFCTPIQDIIEQCNLAGADLYLNTTVCTTDACLTALGNFIAQNLNPGLKVHHEFANETWNITPLYNWCCTASRAFGYTNAPSDQVPYTCIQAGHHWSILGAAMAANGRAADYKRTLASQHGNPGLTGYLVQTCVAHSIQFDELATAPYYLNGPSVFLDTDHTFAALEDMFTIEQCLDVTEMYWMHGQYELEFQKHRDAMVAGGLPSNNKIPIIAYESGPSLVIPYGNIIARGGERGHGVSRHPRYYNILLNSFKIYQDSGLSIMNLYALCLYDYADFYRIYLFAWSAYQGTSQSEYSPGNPTQDNIQINSFNNLNALQSVTGGAHKAWRTMAAQTQSTPSLYDLILPINPIVSISNQIVVVFKAPLTTSTTVTINDGITNASVTINVGDIFGIIPYTPTTSGNRTITATHTGQSGTDPNSLSMNVISNNVTLIPQTNSSLDPESFLEKSRGRKFIGYTNQNNYDKV